MVFRVFRILFGRDQCDRLGRDDLAAETYSDQNLTQSTLTSGGMLAFVLTKTM